VLLPRRDASAPSTTLPTRQVENRDTDGHGEELS
jgi:hypothetical protein